MSQSFDLSNYESVKTRKKKFLQDFPDGRILPKLIKSENNEAVFRVELYKNKEDQVNMLPLSSGYAQEFKGQGGFANKFSWLENCEESAIGRALDNAGYSGNDKCSREEMIKVKMAEENEKRKAEVLNDLKSKLGKLTDNFKDKESLADVCSSVNLPSSWKEILNQDLTSLELSVENLKHYK